MKVASFFSGIGAFEKALDKLEIPYELVAYCETDKYASKSYAAIHSVSEDMNLGDITTVDAKKLPKDIDLLTYGFPCQDISLAGKQKGLFNEDGSQTRSGLFFEALRIIEETQPKVAIAENVKNLTSKKFSEQFKIVLDSLGAAGYNNYWQVLNAKDYGIPQNRERVFIVSIRKDVDTGTFKFPEGFPLQLRLKDMLEDEVDEKFYINTERSNLLIQKLKETKQIGSERVCCDSTINDPKVRDISNCITSRYDAGIQNQKQIGLCVVEPVLFGGMQEHQAIKTDGICTTLTSSMGTGGGYVPMVSEYDKQFKCVQVAQMYGTEKEPNPQAGRIYDPDGISPTVDTCSGGNRMPKVLVREATKQGYAEAFEGDSINLKQPNSKTRRGRVGHSVAQTLTTSPQQAAVVNDLRIRKLTPKECFRLMGFDDADFEKAAAANSNTQLYKQAGNSIVVPVLEHLIKAIADTGVWKGE